MTIAVLMFALSIYRGSILSLPLQILGIFFSSFLFISWKDAGSPCGQWYRQTVDGGKGGRFSM